MRKSGSTNGYVLCVNDFGQPVNFTINVQGDGSFEFTTKIFTTLEEVIAYSRVTPLKSRSKPGERLMLGSPAIRQNW